MREVQAAVLATALVWWGIWSHLGSEPDAPPPPPHPYATPSPLPGQGAGRGTQAPKRLVVAPVVAQVHRKGTPTPTASPTATPTPGAASGEASGACPQLIIDSFGPYAQDACAISWCESRWLSSATGAQGERGWFQIHPAFHADATWDPAGNVAAALRISSGGTNWWAWSTESVLWTGVCPWGGRPPS